ncbi:MAG: hypothetical protein CMJ83_15465 [Planctomycetes bacterium]|nr:hypothetical protein [Planctomycetota bacterium]
MAWWRVGLSLLVSSFLTSLSGAQEDRCLLFLGKAEVARRAGERSRPAAWYAEAARCARMTKKREARRRLTSMVRTLMKPADGSATHRRRRLRAALAQHLVALAIEYVDTGFLATAEETLVLACELGANGADRLAAVKKAINERPLPGAGGRGNSREFKRIMARGDAAYLAGDRAKSHAFYEQADAYLRTIPSTLAGLERMASRGRRYWHDYTTEHLYDQPGGDVLYARARSFLEAKLAISGPLPPRARGHTLLRFAALIIRRTDAEIEIGGEPVHDVQELDDTELQVFKDAWRMAMDTVYVYSRGRCSVETTWIDLPYATVSGLVAHTHLGMVPTRRLDPRRVTPPLDKVYKDVVYRHDGVVFVWDGGRIAKSFGGGPLLLPYRGGRLPKRSGIRRMPREPGGCLHEFMHNVNRHPSLPSVHGPPGSWHHIFTREGIQDPISWYDYMLRKVTHWKRLRYVRR